MPQHYVGEVGKIGKSITNYVAYYLSILCAKYCKNRSTSVDTAVKWIGDCFLTHPTSPCQTDSALTTTIRLRIAVGVLTHLIQPLLYYLSNVGRYFRPSSSGWFLGIPSILITQDLHMLSSQEIFYTPTTNLHRQRPRIEKKWGPWWAGRGAPSRVQGIRGEAPWR